MGASMGALTAACMAVTSAAAILVPWQGDIYPSHACLSGTWHLYPNLLGRVRPLTLGDFSLPGVAGGTWLNVARHWRLATGRKDIVILRLLISPLPHTHPPRTPCLRT